MLSSVTRRQRPTATEEYSHRAAVDATSGRKTFQEGLVGPLAPRCIQYGKRHLPKASPIAPIWPKQLAEYPGYHVRVIPEDTAAPGPQHQYVTPVMGGQPEQFCGALPENALDLRGQARLILPNGSGIGRRSRDEVDEVGLLQQDAIIVAKHRAAR